MSRASVRLPRGIVLSNRDRHIRRRVILALRRTGRPLGRTQVHQEIAGCFRPGLKAEEVAGALAGLVSDGVLVPCTVERLRHRPGRGGVGMTISEAAYALAAGGAS
jgi:hypothetical protein